MSIEIKTSNAFRTVFTVENYCVRILLVVAGIEVYFSETFSKRYNAAHGYKVFNAKFAHVNCQKISLVRSNIPVGTIVIFLREQSLL